MPQSTASRSEWASRSTATSTLLSSRPETTRQAYAIGPISQLPGSSRVNATNSRVASGERHSPYPSLRDPRYDNTGTSTHMSSSVRHERNPYQPELRRQSSFSSSFPPQVDHRQIQHSRRDMPSQRPRSQPASNLPPREAQHKVYLLNCKHCGNFLSDRGMKAVLLLKPNITLYSTDVLPTTCGPLFAPSTFHGGLDPVGPSVERTCECLTQTLGCYGCGSQVGYNIISPCVRCSDSVMKHQRSSNGHRTVLHCSEISVRERRFVQGEPGVRTAKRSVSSDRFEQVFFEQSASGFTPAEMHRHRISAFQRTHSSNGARQTFYEDDDIDVEKADAGNAYYQQQQQLQLQHYHQYQQHVLDERARSNANATRSLETSTGPRVLRHGDVLFWSDLIAGGERAQPFDPDPILERPVAYR